MKKISNFDSYMKYFASNIFRFELKRSPLKLLFESYENKVSKELSNNYNIAHINAFNFIEDLFKLPKFLFVYNKKLSNSEKQMIQ